MTTPIDPIGQAPAYAPRRRPAAIPGFEQALDRLLDIAPPPDAAPDAPPSDQLKLSRHASARLESRGIELQGEELAQLEAAVEELSARGAQKSLVLTDDNAFIVGVPKRTVITVMSRSEALGQIFTDLDSTFVAS